MNEEQQARLEKIRHYNQLSYAVSDGNRVAAGLLRDARKDIDFLLSLLDSPAAGDGQRTPSVLWVSANNDQSGCFDAHKHRHYDDDVQYLHGGDFNASYEDLLRAASLREQNAATRMRDACVAKVKETKFIHHVDCSTAVHQESVCNCFAATITTRLIAALQSLTLDQVERKQ